jgi:hypothetical protein
VCCCDSLALFCVNVKGPPRSTHRYIYIRVVSETFGRSPRNTWGYINKYTKHAYIYVYKHLHDQPASGPEMNEPPAIKSKYLSRRERAATSLPNYTLAQPFLSPSLLSYICNLRGLPRGERRERVRTSRAADVHACCVIFSEVLTPYCKN